jgi:hypothetical protein
MGSPIGFWTLSFSESLRDAEESFLSDILETGHVPRRFFLSKVAMTGILRRADRQKKKLPEHLRRIMELAIQERG